MLEKPQQLPNEGPNRKKYVNDYADKGKACFRRPKNYHSSTICLLTLDPRRKRENHSKDIQDQNHTNCPPRPSILKNDNTETPKLPDSRANDLQNLAEFKKLNDFRVSFLNQQSIPRRFDQNSTTFHIFQQHSLGHYFCQNIRIHFPCRNPTRLIVQSSPTAVLILENGPGGPFSLTCGVRLRKISQNECESTNKQEHKG